ncbi:hypothetical protein D3C71_1997190 [compost metagenome]
MVASEQAGNGDIERQADDALGRRQFGSIETEGFEGSCHHFMDETAAVDQRAVAIEKRQFHQSSSPGSFSSKPSRFQLWTMCGGSGAVTRRRPPSG